MQSLQITLGKPSSFLTYKVKFSVIKRLPGLYTLISAKFKSIMSSEFSNSEHKSSLFFSVKQVRHTRLSSVMNLMGAASDMFAAVSPLVGLFMFDNCQSGVR